MPRKGVPYGDAVCSLKERIAELEQRMASLVNTINHIAANSGDISIAADAPLNVTNDATAHKITVGVSKDNTPIEDSSALVTSGGVRAAIDSEATARQNADAALQTADAQNVKINRINEYAIGLTGNQNSTGTKRFSAIKTPFLEVQSNFRPVIYYGNYDASNVQTDNNRIRPMTVFSSVNSTKNPILKLETIDNASVIIAELVITVYNSGITGGIFIYVRKSDGVAYATAPSRGSTNVGDYSSNEIVTIDTLRKLRVIQ